MADKSQVEQAIDAISGNYGQHEGYRVVHATGTVCKGTFTATPDAARLTRAAHMQGAPVPVTTRFSNGSGNPGMPDYAQDGRGMAVKFYLPDDSRTDIVSLNLPRFFVRTPDDFIAFTKAGKRLPVINQPGPSLALYLLRHREALPAVRAFLALKPPASYAQQRFNGLHAFKWVNADGKESFVRYSWLPEAGEETISMNEAKEAGRHYLREELTRRLDGEGVRFTLEVQVADEGDPHARPDTGLAGRPRKGEGGHLGAHRAGNGPRHRRRRARLRPHARDRRHRARGRSHTRVPLPGVLDLGGAPLRHLPPARARLARRRRSLAR